MKILSAIASIFTLTSACLATTTVAAAPRVTTSIGEDVISMRDDGWYQPVLVEAGFNRHVSSHEDLERLVHLIEIQRG